MKSLKNLFRPQKLKQTPAQAMAAKGDAARDDGDWAAAARAYREALAHDPSQGALEVQYGHALKESGRVSEAVEAYRRAVGMRPEDAETFVHLGHALKRLHRRDEAIAALRAAVALNPDDHAAMDEIHHLAQQPRTGRTSPPEGWSDLDDLSREAGSGAGVSLVTSARNRTGNLLKALPSWLASDEIDEVIIVDWSSDEPVHGVLKEKGLLDPRVRVIRIEDEPRWILSVAFNVGFRAASFDRILKVDADIVLQDGFFAQNPLAEKTFIAGDWRMAGAQQRGVNGFFLIHRADLMEVNGFNEMIVTYGWDDDDLYERLEAAGIRRVGVSADAIAHLPHDDAARVEQNVATSAGARFWSQPAALIDANRIMCLLTPHWSKELELQPFSVRAEGGGLTIGERNGPPPHEVPETVRRDAERYAVIKHLSTKAGRIAYQIAPDILDRLMSASGLEALTPLSISLAATRPDCLSVNGNYLIVRINSDIRHDQKALTAALTALEATASAAGFEMVVADGNAAALSAVLDGEVQAAVLPHAPGAPALSAAELGGLTAHSVAPGDCRTFHLNAAAARALAPAGAAPAASAGRDKIYIDAQHGLGNRLRAIASAAAIAEKSDRELVIIWRPDHHCACDFADLFDYGGPVLTDAFLDGAREDGLAVVNYMEIEDGADRGAPVMLTPGVSVYARSAYVLNHPASDRTAENAFLRGLTPARPVMDLVDSVRAQNDVGVHVRMEAAPGTKIHSYDSPANWPEEDHVLLQEWRAKSHFSNFMARLDQMIERGEAGTIFLAADMPETYAAFREAYGDRVACLDRALYDRSREQMRYALADAILLSRSGAMLGSGWSSFSEIALRLSTRFDRIQLSGEDF